MRLPQFPEIADVARNLPNCFKQWDIVAGYGHRCQEEHLAGVVSTSNMPIQDTIFGKPLATSEERAEQIGVGGGIPIFGLDALTSAAYGPEAALSLLIPLGILRTQYLVTIVTSILILLVIVYFSYRQTIAAYPSGGGSYTVASENLGERAGLLAAAAL